jgi:ParB family transcriptional regulator, chromosome partitioning protein
VQTSAVPKNTTPAETFHPALPIHQIHPSPTNPRKQFDEEDLAELAESIKTHGVVQPVVVRPHPSIKGAYELVVGERRWRGSRKAARETIPAIERDLDNTAVLEIQIIENLQRKDVHELDEANGFRALIAEAGFTVQGISDRLGKSKKYVWDRMKLAELVPQLQKMFYARELTAGHAILLARLPAISQNVAIGAGLFENVYRGGKNEKELRSVRELAEWIQENIHSDLDKAIFDQKDPGLVKKAGHCEICPKRASSTCLDRVCFSQKVQAFIDQKLAAKEWVGATTEYGRGDKMPYWYYLNEAKANSCDFVKKVVCVDGREKGTLKTVCLSTSCKTHHPPASRSSSSTSNSAAQRERKQKAAQELKYRTALYETLQERIDMQIRKATNPFPIGKVPLAIIAATLFEHVDHDLQQQALKELGVTVGSIYEQRGKIEQKLQALPEKSLTAFVLKLALRNDLEVNQYARDMKEGAENLHAAAAFYKVDVARLRQQIQAEAAKAKVPTTGKKK